MKSVHHGFDFNLQSLGPVPSSQRKTDPRHEHVFFLRPAILERNQETESWFFFSCTKCAKKRVSERAGPKILADHERGCFDKLEWKLLWEPAEPVRKWAGRNNELLYWLYNTDSCQLCQNVQYSSPPQPNQTLFLSNPLHLSYCLAPLQR